MTGTRAPPPGTSGGSAPPGQVARASVAAYYTSKIRRHGATPAGVDWVSAVGQELRFALLLRVCDFAAPFSLNDVGCGYGALLGYLERRHAGGDVDYCGSDLSVDMIRRAERRWTGRTRARFVHAGAAPRTADYAVASGIFNVVPMGAAGCWDEVVASTLTELHASTRRGFAVNFLAPGPHRAGLYRTPPDPWIAYCERNLGEPADALTGYGLDEFTLVVRRKSQQDSAARACASTRS